MASPRDHLASNLAVPAEAIRAFCSRWKLRELSLFGSILRDDFGPQSDVDVLVAFALDGAMTFEGFLQMREELSELFGGRAIDLVEKRLVTNPFRRHDILTTRRVLYAA